MTNILIDTQVFEAYHLDFEHKDFQALQELVDSGKIEVFEGLQFHFGSTGPALEMREFSEEALRAGLLGAGFDAIQIYSDDVPAFGVIRAEGWSLPIAARKGSAALSRDAARDVIEQWDGLRKSCREWAASRWVRLGAKLGLIDIAPLLSGQSGSRRPPRK